MHKKRQEMPKTWPVEKKEFTYMAKPTHSAKDGISLLFILRNVLKIAKNRKEAKFITLSGKVKVNNKVRKNENFPLSVFDVLSFEGGKDYRLQIVNRKFKLIEISGKETETKIVKISGKKIVGKNKTQMNLEDGTNMISKEKFSVGDSVLLNTKEDKIQEILPLKEGASIEVIGGKHAGEKGKLTRIEGLKRNKIYFVKLKNVEAGLPLKTILVIK